MIKIPCTRLSLFAFIALSILAPATGILAAKKSCGKSETFALKKSTLNSNELAKLTQRSNQLRLLPPCSPPPGTPSSGLVPTQNPAAPAVTFFPNNAVSNSAVVPPQTVGTQFIAGSLATFPAYLGSAPNTMGVAGPDQYIMAINGGLVSFDKLGNRDGFLDVDASSFLDLDGDFSLFIDITDPRIRYDKFTDRYFYTILNLDSSGTTFPNGVSLAVSDTGILSNNTRWTVVNIFNASLIPDSIGCGGDSNQFFDFVTMSIDQNAVYISFVLVDGASQLYTSNTIFVVQKASLLVDGPVYTTAFYDVTGFPGDSFPVRKATVTLQTVDNFDANPEFGYLIGQAATEFGKLILFRVSNPGSLTPTLSGPISLNVPTTGSNTALGAPFLGNLFGSIGQLSPLDDRLQSAHIRNNQLYTIHTIPVTISGVGSPTGDRLAQRWYQIDVTGAIPTLVQAGTLWDSAASNPLFYYYGTIMTNARGDLAISGTVSSLTVAPSAFFAGRLAGDPLGTLRKGTTVNDIIYAQGQGGFSQYLALGTGGLTQRWGDTSYISLDPVDDMTMWTIQQISFNGIYRLAVAQLLAP